MFVSLLCALLSGPVSFGQTDTASINGYVHDSSGAAAPGAMITAVHVATNARYTAAANEHGYYLLTPLRIGIYTLSVELAGFKKELITALELQVQQRANLNFDLEVGQVSEQIVVEGTAPLLSSQDTSMGQVVTNRQIVELPLNGRNYLQLGVLAAGIVPALKGKNNDNDTGFVANGLRYSMNNYLLDGVDNNSQITNLQSGGAEITRPSIDAIQEFKIQTSTFSAEFGRSAGAVINVTTKSGANRFHGTAYEFHRNAALDARNFFDRQDQPQPPFIQNQFGGTLGGRVVRDKTFFFGSWEGTRVRKGITNISTLPSAAQRAGDFGARPMFDPATVRPNPAGAGFVRDPFAGNRIPANRLDPVAARVIALYPQPTGPGAANNYTISPKQSDTADQIDTRWDHRFSDRDSIYGRLSYQDRNLFVPPPLPLPAVGSTSDRISDQLFTSRNLAVVHTHIFSPATVNEFRLGFNRVRADLFPFVRDRLSDQLGLQGVSKDPSVTGLASFQPQGFAALGDSPFLPNLQASQTLQFIDNLSVLRGNHSLKFGLDIRLPDSIYDTSQRGRGLLNFSGEFTQNPQARAASGNSMGDFLLGLASNGVISNALSGNLKQRGYQFYVQDDWKVTSKLTINAGLRYEYISPFFEKNDQQANFIPFPGARGYGTVLLAGKDVPRGLTNKDWNNFAPRLGIAYQITPKTVIRVAAGVFYSHNELWGVVNRPVSNRPFHLISTFPTDQITPNLMVRNGFPSDALTLAPRAPNFVSFHPDSRAGLTQQWNFNIQRQLPGDIVWETAYVGSNSIKLPVGRDVNQPRLGPGPLPPRRQFSDLGIVQLYEPMGTANYQSLQVRAEKRFSGGLAFVASYTVGKALELAPQQTAGPLPRLQNNLDLSNERGRTGSDTRQRFVFSHTYDLPFGAGKRWKMAGLRGVFFGGWQLSGVMAMQSGLPFTVGVGFDPSRTGLAGFNARPNRIASGDLQKSDRTLDRWFDLAAFTVPANDTFGNAGRQIINGPGLVNLDLGLNKVFRLSEQFRLQLRSEFFNFTNTPKFDQPGGGTIETAGRPQITLPGAAAIRRTLADARQIQFGMKLVF